MYHRVRKKMSRIIISAIILLVYPLSLSCKTLEISTTFVSPEDEGLENNIIDFDEEYAVKFSKNYDTVPWNDRDFDKNAHRYTLDKDDKKHNKTNVRYDPNNNSNNSYERETTVDYSVIPLELVSTTEDVLVSIIESTTEPDLTVIPLSTTKKLPSIIIEQTVTLPSTTEYDVDKEFSTTENVEKTSTEINSNKDDTTTWEHLTSLNQTTTDNFNTTLTTVTVSPRKENTRSIINSNYTENDNITNIPNSKVSKAINTTSSNKESKTEDSDVPIFTELDAEDIEGIPEDYYDSKDILPTSAPKTDAISVLFGLAGSVVESVVESVAEKVVPKSIYDLFKRMQRQNEALEAERLRSREENGGLGQFGRGILKSLSSGLSKPLSQLMAGVKEAGSLDTDRGFVGNVASSVTSVANAANTYLEAFKDKVQAIYPGTVWCGDGHSAQARSSSDLGLFFFTDTCCRQHDACKIFIKAGETKYGLTNTGLFTRSHCSCDTKFRACLHRTSSLVSAQIGLTYFNVLGPQCFRRAHPIVKCAKRTRITGQKCEEYELDYTKPKMWQWFDNETF